MTRHYPKHKKSGLPSLSFLYGSFKRHLDQRITFQIEPDEYETALLLKLGFDMDKPIYVNGVFNGFFKKRGPRDGDWHTPIQIYLRILRPTFLQGEKKATYNFPSYGRVSRKLKRQKRGGWEFGGDRIKGLPINLANQVPQLTEGPPPIRSA